MNRNEENPGVVPREKQVLLFYVSVVKFNLLHKQPSKIPKVRAVPRQPFQHSRMTAVRIKIWNTLLMFCRVSAAQQKWALQDSDIFFPDAKTGTISS